MRLGQLLKLSLILLLLAIPAALAEDEIPTPEKYFGHIMGEEGSLLDYNKSLAYYQLLDKLSDRIIYQEIGKTTDGNPFVLLFISSPENLRNLDTIRKKRDLLCMPGYTKENDAERLARQLPAVVFHTGSIHSSEISTAQVPPEVVYRLVSESSDEINQILLNTVIIYSPSANPDGQIKYNAWYEKHKGKAWEGRMPWLYHTYVGHDNNRDWVMLNFPEQRLTATEVHQKWHPIYSLEMHEFGSSAARIFVPPYIDPFDPNTASEVINNMNMLGQAISHRLTTEGKGGVVMNAHFDLFTPARAFQVYRGTARILTETSSGNFTRSIDINKDQLSIRWGTPAYDPQKRSWNFPLPWEGGTWTFRDRVEYQVSANFALLNLAASHRYLFNMSMYRALKRATDPEDWPYAYYFPTEQDDPGAAATLLRLFQMGGVYVHRVIRDFETEGVEIKAGSHVVILRQPYAAWAKTLLEIQEYPDLRKSEDEDPVVPYDVTGHTLPLLMGIKAIKLENRFVAQVEVQPRPIFFKGVVEENDENGYLISPDANDSFAVIDNLLDSGFKVLQLTESVDETPAGTFVLPPAPELKKTLLSMTGIRSFKANSNNLDRNKLPLSEISNPRIAMYEPWGGTMDGGWTRFVFEKFGIEFDVIRNADFLNNSLEQYDVILFPSELNKARLLYGSNNWPEEYCGGIGKEGLSSLKTYINNGGTVVGWGRTSTLLAELLELPIANKVEDLDPQKHFTPGSIVLAEFDTTHPVNYGLSEKTAVMLRWGPMLIPSPTPEQGPEMAGVYPDYDPRLSGFLLGPEYVSGSGALAVQKSGKGNVVLFSYFPQFRAMTYATFKQLFNIAFWSARK